MNTLTAYGQAFRDWQAVSWEQFWPAVAGSASGYPGLGQ